MAAHITTVSRGLIWTPGPVQRLWFFPEGSKFLRYSPHFHYITEHGYRQNLPLSHMFVVVFEGKLSIKDFWGVTQQKIDVIDQVWWVRGRPARATHLYAKMLGRTKEELRWRRSA